MHLIDLIYLSYMILFIHRFAIIVYIRSYKTVDLLNHKTFIFNAAI
jgi:hypothetical protein